MKRHFTSERLEKLRKIFLLLVPLIYATVLSFSLSAEWFPADDGQELVFVRGIPSIGALFKADAFGLFRPVKNLLFRLFVAMSPLGVKSCRLVGIAIGVASFFPVLALCRRVFGNEWKATLAVTIWILSPTLVSSTAWMSGVNIQLMAAFSALSLVYHDAAWDSYSFNPKRIVIAGLFLFLALVSYESAIALVPLLFLFDFYLRPNRIRSRSAWMSYGTYATVAAVYLLLRHVFRASTMVNGSFTELERWQLVVSSPYFTWQHFESWFWPFGHFSVLGSYQWGQAPWPVLGGCVVFFSGILLFAIATRKRLPTLSFCILFSLVAFAPVSNCLGLKNGPYGDYYMTLPSIGLAAGFVEVLDILLSSKGRLRAVSLAIVFFSICIRLFSVPEAARWARLWGRGESAFAESLRNYPNWFSNKQMLTRLLFDKGEHDEALRLGSEIENQIGSSSHQMGGIYILRALHALQTEKDAEKALREIDKCHEVNTVGASETTLHFYRGCVFEDLKNDETTAEKEYELALAGKWNIDSVPCADRLARLKAIHGERDEAIALWERAAKLEPSNASVLWNLSIAYREAGDLERAEKCRSAALRLFEQQQ